MSTASLPLTGPALGRRRPRASLYVRLSKEADAANTSKENMIANLREMCAKHDFAEVALHIDDGLSGAIRNRPEFLAWLNDGRQGRADVLLAWHVDRMTREGGNVAAIILDVVEGKDTVTGQVVFPPVRLMDWHGLDSNDGLSFRIQFFLKAEFAREERERIKARQKGRATRLRLMGRWPGGEVPFGYRIIDAPDGAGKTLALAEEEVEALRDAASHILDGDTLGRTVRRMNYAGIKPRRAPEWSRTTLAQALTGDHILGRVTIDGVLQRDEDGRPFAPFPEVLDLPTVVELRKALSPSGDPRKRGGRKPSRLASRLVSCHSCGGLLNVIRRNGSRTAKEIAAGRAGRSDLIAYRCQRRADGGVCDHPALVSAEPFEQYLEARFLADFGRLPMVERRVIMADDGKLAEVEEQISGLLARLAQAATADAFARLQELQAERDVLAQAPREPQVVKVLTGRTMAEEWHAADLDGRREMLDDAYQALIIGPGKRGRRGFDPARLTVIYREGEHDPD
ncbi:recombinase family protein [Micromonospora sp. NPDC023956]|uniref:recombinase family protein n=1 Tax=Micromonospora sp. NPDC023956 TaxID=3155722 RepID=UPI0033C59B00